MSQNIAVLKSRISDEGKKFPEKLLGCCSCGFCCRAVVVDVVSVVYSDIDDDDDDDDDNDDDYDNYDDDDNDDDEHSKVLHL